MELSAQKSKKQVDSLNKERDQLVSDIKLKMSRLDKVQQELYVAQLRSLHLEEIYRLAQIHLPRLRGEKEGKLIQADIQELEKWISRAKSNDGLKAIVDALEELQKYFPHDVKSNLYALVQRIIIGGAFHGKGKKKK